MFVVDVALEHPGLPSLVLSVQGCCFNQLVMYNITCHAKNTLSMSCLLLCAYVSHRWKVVQQPNSLQQQCDDIGGGVPTLETPNSSRS